MQNTLKAQYEQYRNYLESVEMIQIKCHDLKHQIAGLRTETDAEKRKEWLALSQSKDAPRDIPGRWYKPNTREPIRDETIREMVRLNAVIERAGLATTSPITQIFFANSVCRSV